MTDQFMATRVLYDSNPNVEWRLLGVPVKSYKMRFPCCKVLSFFHETVFNVLLTREVLKREVSDDIRHLSSALTLVT